MTRVPSRDCDMRGLRPNRAREILRVVYLLAVAVVTMACAGLTSAGSDVFTVGARIELAAAQHGAQAKRDHGAARRAVAPEPKHRLRDGGTRPNVDRDAVETDLDDDDFDEDARSDVAEHRVLVQRALASARRPGRALRGEPQSDTSRFAVSTGLARGPPSA